MIPAEPRSEKDFSGSSIRQRRTILATNEGTTTNMKGSLVRNVKDISQILPEAFAMLQGHSI